MLAVLVLMFKSNLYNKEECSCLCKENVEERELEVTVETTKLTRPSPLSSTTELTRQTELNQLPGVPKEVALLLVMVISSFRYRERREAIRETWKNSYLVKGKQFKVKFVIGTLQLSPTELAEVTAENDRHSDLVLLTDHFDTYNNLTKKVLQMFIWVDQNTNSRYVLKIDDDCFARLDVIESELKERQNTKGLLWGFFVSKWIPKTAGKWKEDRWFLCQTYLPYTLGGGYLLSADLVHRIVVNSDAILLYRNEDVTIGTWTSMFDIERRHDYRFQVDGGRFYDCDNSNIVIHCTGPDSIREKHERMLTNGVLCDVEKHGYSNRCSNWNFQTNKCCSEKNWSC